MNEKKKEAIQIQSAEDFRMSTGITFYHHEYKEIPSSERFFLCILRGVLIYLGLFGTTGLFISSLELPCNQLIIFSVEFVISMLVALLYYHKWLFNIGYIVFFILFCFIAFTFVVYANSGFNAIMNHVMAKIDIKLNLDGYREYTETISNSYVTITICLILLSFLGVCFLNSSISSYMSPAYLALQLFPIIQICLYLDDSVNYFYIAVIVVCWLSVYLIKRSKKYRIILSRKKELFFQCDGMKFQYRESSFKKTFINIFTVGCVLGCFFFFLCFGIARIMPSSFRNNHSSMKVGTDRIVAEFAMNGFWGFFDNFQAAGGMSGGKLGGVRQVYMDFETDLQVAYVPYSTDPLYLKGYVGEKYTGNSWEQLSDYHSLMEYPYYLSDFSLLVNKEALTLKKLFEKGESGYAQGKMQIINVDADTGFYYIPYYSEVDTSNMIYLNGEFDLLKGDIIASETPIGDIVNLTYYPLFDKWNFSDNFNDYEYVYRDYVYEKYLQVPDKIRGELEDICESIGLNGTTDEIIEQIQEYFYNEYVYSLSPGKTPNKRDFVVYFLTRQKRGYCAHFASAGAMLLRTMGIPARYVEGYCFSVNSTSDVEVLQGEDAEEWYQGYSLLSNDASEQKVLSIDVTDASAHAWVEVYYDGFGWVPVEFTIARQEESTDEGSFWSNFSNFFGGGNADTEGGVFQNFNNQIKKTTPYLVLIVLILFVIVLCIWYGRRFARMYQLYFRRDNNRLIKQYQAITKLLKKYGFSEKNNVFHEDMQNILISKLGMEEGIITQYRSYIEQASYGKDPVKKENLEWCTLQFKLFITELKRRVSKKQRMILALKY